MERGDIEEMLLASSEKLKKYAFCLTQDWNKTNDLLQETYKRILYNADKFEDYGKFLNWARSIMHNAFMNENKREERYQVVEELFYTTPLAPINYNNDYIDTKIDVKDIYNAIDNLPGNASKVMRLLISGHKYGEISVLLEIPLGTVKTRISISRAILKEKLKDFLN